FSHISTFPFNQHLFYIFTVPYKASQNMQITEIHFHLHFEVHLYMFFLFAQLLHKVDNLRRCLRMGVFFLRLAHPLPCAVLFHQAPPFRDLTLSCPRRHRHSAVAEKLDIFLLASRNRRSVDHRDSHHCRFRTAETSGLGKNHVACRHVFRHMAGVSHHADIRVSMKLKTQRMLPSLVVSADDDDLLSFFISLCQLSGKQMNLSKSHAPAHHKKYLSVFRQLQMIPYSVAAHRADKLSPYGNSERQQLLPWNSVGSKLL